MKLSLKNVKIAHSLSEETVAFSATLYVDGRKTAEVRNRGTGGSNEYDVVPHGYKRPMDYDESRDRLNKAEDYAREKTGDDVEALDFLIATMIDDEEMWKSHRRREKIRVRYVDGADLMEWKPRLSKKLRPEHLEGIKGAPWWKESNKMLNGLGKDEFIEAVKGVA